VGAIASTPFFGLVGPDEKPNMAFAFRQDFYCQKMISAILVILS
jgi:hypothetical protein